MFKKLSIALLSLAMAVSCFGCGSEKESSSSSKSESSVIETAEESEIEEETVPETEAAVDEDSESDSTAENEIPEADTDEVKEAILGKWTSGYVVDAMGNTSSLNDYCELLGLDPSTMQMEMEFMEDGTLKLNSSTDGEETGTYTVDGAEITMTDDADGSTMLVICDMETEMLLVDITGTGELYIGFTM